MSVKLKAQLYQSMIYPYELKNINLDSTKTNNKSNSPTKKDKWTPGRTALASLIVPGSGQIINHQWIKTPIIYAALIGAGYLIVTNNRQYIRYRNAYRLRISGDSTKLDEFNPKNPNVQQVNYIYNADQILTQREDYKSNRDQSILLGIVLYGANVIDAYVFSHLKRFSISDDLSLRFNPPKLNYNQALNNINFITGIVLDIN
jgi:hypothetical protein